MNDGGANQPMPLVHNGIMYLGNTGQHRAGARRRDRRSDLGKPRRPESSHRLRLDAQHRDLRRQGLHRHHRRAAWSRSTRAPARTSGRSRSPTAPRASTSTERPDRREGQGHPGPAAAAIAIAQTIAASSAPTTRRPASSCGSSTPSRATGEPGGDTWGKLPDLLRAGGDTWIAGSYDPDLESDLLGRRAGQAVDAGEPRHRDQRRGALHRVDRRAARQTTARWPGTYQHVPGEIARSGRGVRARAGRHRPGQRSSSRSARPASCGSSIARPASSSATRRPSSRTSSTRIDPEDGRRRPIAQDIVDQKLDEWVQVVPEHRRRTQLAGDELSPADAPADHSAEPVVHGDCRRARSSSRRDPAAPPPAAASSRCRAATATSASSRRIDVTTMKEMWSARAARAVPDGGADHRRRRRVRRRLSIATSAPST